MDPSFSAFTEELTKIATMGELWQRFLDIFRADKERDARRVEYHFSPKAGFDKWTKLPRNAQSAGFVAALEGHPAADAKLIRHVKALHALSKGRVLGKIQSARLPGRTYEVKQTPVGMACTCPDWRYVGSVTPGYECKHIQAYKEGRVKAS